MEYNKQNEDPQLNNQMWLKGHSIFLKIPDEDDILRSNWHNWYNDYETTKFNNHGIFPVSKRNEIKFIQKELEKHNKILAGIFTIKECYLIGNISLQNIDLLNRNAEITITLGEKQYSGTTAALEAVGLMTSHGFERLNLERIYGGSHESLSRWVKMKRVFGYEKEGIGRHVFFRNGEFYNAIYFSVLSADYWRLREDRGGKFLLNSRKELLINTIKLAGE